MAKYLMQLKVFDPDNTLSLSNVMLMVLIVKVAVSPLDWTILTALFLGLLNHNARKIVRFKERKVDQSVTDQLASLDREVKQVTSALSLTKLGR